MSWDGGKRIAVNALGEGLAKTALRLPAGDWDTHSIARPMFVDPEGQDVLVLVLAKRKTGEGTPAPSAGAQGLLICRLGADGHDTLDELYPPPQGKDTLRVHVGAYGAYLLVLVQGDAMERWERCVLAFSGDLSEFHLALAVGGG